MFDHRGLARRITPKSAPAAAASGTARGPARYPDIAGLRGRAIGMTHSSPAFFTQDTPCPDHERLISMKAVFYLATALIGATAIPSGHAVAANVCRADPLVCPTTMPVDGFCQCRASGMTANGIGAVFVIIAIHRVLRKERLVIHLR